MRIGGWVWVLVGERGIGLGGGNKMNRTDRWLDEG